MIRTWIGLPMRLALAALVAVVIQLACTLVGLVLPLSMLVALGLLGGALWWVLGAGAERADQLHAPALDLDADYALPHAQDTRVRRLEDLAHGAQPSRRMTSRGLARTLDEIAEERARDPEAPALSTGLERLLETARHPDAETHPVGPIDRRTLHRCLTELASREERDR